MILGALGNLDGPTQFAELGLALGLALLIGTEREIRQKSAGLRTHSLVGLGAALFMLISKYGFEDVLVSGKVVVDPSRVAAQIVTGIGFLGAGVIFVRQDAVRGLTTAASIWFTAAVGACAGAGLPLLALLSTGAYFIIALGLRPFVRRLPGLPFAASELTVRYLDGKGALRDIMGAVTDRGFSVAEFSSAPHAGDIGKAREIEVRFQLYGRGSMHELAAQLGQLDGVQSIQARDFTLGGE